MPVPSIPQRGKLEVRPVPILMRALLSERRDGCLTVRRGTITRRIYLRDGMITYATSTEPSDRLGEILVVQGKLTRADHKGYWEESQASNRLLGMTLLVNGRITLQDLYQGVTAQVVTIFDRVQRWRTGDYLFSEGEAPAAGTVLLQIPLALYLRPEADQNRAWKRGVTRGAGRKRSAAGAQASGRAGRAQPIETHRGEPGAATAIGSDAAAQLARIGEISFMVQELRARAGQDLCVLLGVPPSSDPATVEAGFQRIARVIHPDRLPAGIAPELAREAEAVFRGVSAVYEGAKGEKRRLVSASAEAAAAPKRVRPPDPQEDPARRFFAQGREWMSQRNYWQAADALRQAVRLRPDEAAYRRYLGLALMRTKRLHEAEEHLVEASRLEPNNAAHFVNLGRLYLAGRVLRKAREAFEQALRLDPRNEKAREELGDLPEEPPPGRKLEPGGGLLKKFFGKG